MHFFARSMQIVSLSPAEVDKFGHAECELAYLIYGFGYWLCTVQAVSTGLWAYGRSAALAGTWSPSASSRRNCSATARTTS